MFALKGRNSHSLDLSREHRISRKKQLLREMLQKDFHGLNRNKLAILKNLRVSEIEQEELNHLGLEIGFRIESKDKKEFFELKFKLFFSLNFPFQPPALHLDNALEHQVSLRYLEDQTEWRATITLTEIVNDFAEQICGYMNEQSVCFGIKYGEEKGEDMEERKVEQEDRMSALEEQLKNLELEMW